MMDIFIVPILPTLSIVQILFFFTSRLQKRARSYPFMSRKRIILSAGGTGGHLFPAQEAARKLSEWADILFVGGNLSKSAFFAKDGFAFEEIPVAPLQWKRPAASLYTLARGFMRSRAILKRFKPDLVIGFGSFYTFPLLAAAALQNLPILLHEQNSLPGVVNRLFSRRALTTAIGFPEARSRLHGKSTLVDLPFSFPRAEGKRAEAHHYYGLDGSKKTLLAFGGSQGSSGINRLVARLIPMLPKDFQLIHFSGDKFFSTVSTSQRAGYVVKPFEKRMDLALAASDLVIARSGASTVSELIEWELPAILVPFPLAKENHQEENARHFTSVVKGGSFYQQESLEEPEALEILLERIDSLLSEEGEVRRSAIVQYKKTREAKSFVELVREYL